MWLIIIFSTQNAHKINNNICSTMCYRLLLSLKKSSESFGCLEIFVCFFFRCNFASLHNTPILLHHYIEANGTSFCGLLVGDLSVSLTARYTYTYMFCGETIVKPLAVLVGWLVGVVGGEWGHSRAVRARCGIRDQTPGLYAESIIATFLLKREGIIII